MFDWEDFFRLAQELAGRDSCEPLNEAAKRTAVSRAYYAAFCAARDHAVQQLNYQSQQTGRDHSELQKHLRGLGGQWKAVADNLENLRKIRNQCDYDQQVSNLDTIASWSLKLASKVLNAL